MSRLPNAIGWLTLALSLTISRSSESTAKHRRARNCSASAREARLDGFGHAVDTIIERAFVGPTPL